MEQNIFRQDMLERKKDLTRIISKGNETYMKLELPNGEQGKQILYVKGTWFPTHFILSVLDGQDTWSINGMQKNGIFFFNLEF